MFGLDEGRMNKVMMHYFGFQKCHLPKRTCGPNSSYLILGLFEAKEQNNQDANITLAIELFGKISILCGHNKHCQSATMYGVI